MFLRIERLQVAMPPPAEADPAGRHGGRGMTAPWSGSRLAGLSRERDPAPQAGAGAVAAGTGERKRL